MRWLRAAKEAVVAAGGGGSGGSVTVRHLVWMDSMDGYFVL